MSSAGRDPAFCLFGAIRKAIAGTVPDTSLRPALLKENERAAEPFLSKAEEAEASEDESRLLAYRQKALTTENRS